MCFFCLFSALEEPWFLWNKLALAKPVCPEMYKRAPLYTSEILGSQSPGAHFAVPIGAETVCGRWTPPKVLHGASQNSAYIVFKNQDISHKISISRFSRRESKSNSVQPILNGNDWLELRNGCLFQAGDTFKFVTIPAACCCKGYRLANTANQPTYFVWPGQPLSYYSYVSFKAVVLSGSF